ncbi:MAG TPA: DUF2752 domain-containing protein [Verrucomicrobiae bacterium]|jgi:hypothetical protein|nr:DUF2752 domain-containing protein [Verrucomicrobiae bacterium]
MFTGSNLTRVGFPSARALLLAGVCLLCATGALIYFAFDPTQVAIFPPCMFHQITGLDCPGCGAQRALHQLLHGNLIAAFQLNAMFVLSLPLAAWFGLRWMWLTMRGGSLPLNARWLWCYLAAWILFGLLRNLPFPIFQWFAA